MGQAGSVDHPKCSGGPVSETTFADRNRSSGENLEDNIDTAPEQVIASMSTYQEVGGRQSFSPEPPRSAIGTRFSSYTEPGDSVLVTRTLFEGSPSYKRRRKRAAKRHRRSGTSASIDDGDESSSEVEHLMQQPPFAPAARENDYLLHAPRNVTRPPVDDTLGGSVQTIFDDTSIPGWSTMATTILVPQQNDGPQVDLQNGLIGGLARPPGGTMLLDVPSVGSTSSAANTPPNVTLGRSFSCPLLSCGRIFKRLEHLRRHVRTHTQERPFGCMRCSKRFSRSDNLTQHLKTHDKTDRGERLRTEASESTEEDIVNYLEAEVEAMAAREHGLQAGLFGSNVLSHNGSVETRFAGTGAAGEYPANAATELQ
jgi:hypothetical protein